MMFGTLADSAGAGEGNTVTAPLRLMASEV
jgi:hypothetical protein